MPARGQSQEADYDTEFQKGLDLLRRRQYEEALKSFKRANEMRDKKSAECFFGMAQAYQGLEAHKNVAEACDKMILFSEGDPKKQAQAYNLKGIALQALAEIKDQKKLQEAEAAFRQGLALGVDLPVLHYNLGFTLMQQNRDPEGVAELKKYVDLQSGGTYVEQARKLIENPRRAREAYAPEFSITTSEGEYIALEDLRGKVVVLDFWGTWCPPCVASVPSLRSLHKRLAKEPSFMMIGISSDSEEETWRAFTTKEKMVWPQYWDRDRRVQRAFGVRAFPTYIVIDHEGIVRFRSSGTSWERTANLEDAIRKQVKIVAKTAPVD
jgi:peroxiredoxin/Flp pilus assembly protein TadD